MSNQIANIATNLRMIFETGKLIKFNERENATLARSTLSTILTQFKCSSERRQRRRKNNNIPASQIENIVPLETLVGNKKRKICELGNAADKEENSRINKKQKIDKEVGTDAGASKKRKICDMQTEEGDERKYKKRKIGNEVILYADVVPQVDAEVEVVYADVTPRVPDIDKSACEIPQVDVDVFQDATPQVEVEIEVIYAEETPRVDVEVDVIYADAIPQVDVDNDSVSKADVDINTEAYAIPQRDANTHICIIILWAMSIFMFLCEAMMCLCENDRI